MDTESRSVREIVSNKTARIVLIGIGGILLIIIFTLILLKEAPMPFDQYNVARGDLEVLLVEAADIAAVNYTELRAPGGGRRWNQQLSQIVYLAEEGLRVEKGDTLIKFDVTDLITQKETKEEQLLLTQQEYDVLLETHKSQDETEKRAIQNASFAVENARLNLQLAQFESETTKRERELELQIQKIDSMKVMTNIEANQALRRFNREKRLDDIKEIKDDIDDIDEKIDSYNMLAPFSGLVVHAKDGWPVPVAVKEGDTPYPMQRLIRLPDLSQIKAIMHINDIDRDRVWVGQRGRLISEAFPDKSYPGKVISVDQLPQNAISYGYSNIKVLEAIFIVDKPDEILRPGMSGTIELFVDVAENVVHIPMSSIFESSGKPYVYRIDGDDFEFKEIELGRRSSTMIEVINGLSEGDNILVNYPFVAGFPVGQYAEWDRQDNAIAQLNEHFNEIERLGIQYDYDRFRDMPEEQRTDSERSSFMQREITDDQIKEMLERRGQEATPENIRNARQMMERMLSGEGRGGMMRGEGADHSRNVRPDSVRVKPDSVRTKD